MDFNFSGTEQIADRNFSITDQIAHYKDDLYDTYNNQSKVLDTLIELQKCATKEDFLLIQSNFPLTFTYDDQLLQLSYDGIDNLLLNVVNNNSIIELDSVSLDDYFDPDTSTDLVFQSEDNTYDIPGNVTSYVSDSMASTEVLISYADALITAANSDRADVLSTFNSAVQGIKGGSASVDQLIFSLSQNTNQLGDTVGGGLSVLRNVFSNIMTTNISDGNIEFNNKQYYVQGFAYSHIIGTIISGATSILGAVVSKVAPIVGFTLLSATQSLATVFSGNFLSGETIPTVDLNANNNLFAVPLLQSHFPVSQIANSPSIGQYKDDFLNLIDTVKTKGSIMTLKLAYGDLLCWVRKIGSVDELYMEVYADVDLYMSQSPEYRCSGTVTDNKLTTTDYKLAFEGLTNVIPVGKANQIDWLRSAYMYQYGDLPKYYPTLTANSYCGAIAHNICYLITLAKRGMFSNVNVDRYGSNEEKAAYWFDYVGHNAMDYATLVNEMIPDLFNHLGAISTLAATCYLLYAWFETWKFVINSTDDNDFKQACNIIASLTPGTYKVNVPTWYLPDRGNFKVSPPSYSSSAISNTRLILAGVLMTSVAIAVSASVIKAKLKPLMKSKYADVQTAAERYDVLQDKDSWKAYKKAVKRYNLLANFTGYSKLSMISGWETGDVESNSASMVLSDTVMSKIQAVTGKEDYPQEVNLQSIISLIK